MEAKTWRKPYPVDAYIWLNAIGPALIGAWCANLISNLYLDLLVTVVLSSVFVAALESWRMSKWPALYEHESKRRWMLVMVGLFGVGIGVVGFVTRWAIRNL